MKYGPYICDLCLLIDALLHSLGETLVPEISSEWRNLRPFWFLHVASMQWKESSIISVRMAWGPQIAVIWHQIDVPSLLQKCQFCMHDSQSTLKMTVLLWKILVWDHSDHEIWTLYVICAFGSMLSCILCERQKFSESHKLKCFGARYQFRAARFVTVSFIGFNMNAMELVVRN